MIAHPQLLHHRTYGSVYGGSVRAGKPSTFMEKAPSPARSPAPNARTRCNRPRSVRTGDSAAPTPYPTHRAGCSTTAAITARPAPSPLSLLVCPCIDHRTNRPRFGSYRSALHLSTHRLLWLRLTSDAPSQHLSVFVALTSTTSDLPR